MTTETVTNFDIVTWLRDTRQKTSNGLIYDLCDWVLDYDPETLSVKSAIDMLERIDCAGCFAPDGLIYNAEVAEKAAKHWNEIDSATDDYLDQTGEHWKPKDGAITIGSLVWFAYEWTAHNLANELRGASGMED